MLLWTVVLLRISLIIKNIKYQNILVVFPEPGATALLLILAEVLVTGLLVEQLLIQLTALFTTQTLSHELADLLMTLLFKRLVLICCFWHSLLALLGSWVSRKMESINLLLLMKYLVVVRTVDILIILIVFRITTVVVASGNLFILIRLLGKWDHFAFDLFMIFNFVILLITRVIKHYCRAVFLCNDNFFRHLNSHLIITLVACDRLRRAVCHSCYHLGVVNCCYIWWCLFE